MRFLDAIAPRPRQAAPSTVSNATVNSWFNGLTGTLAGSSPTLPDSTFRSMVECVHNESGPVSAAVATRALLLSQVQFAWKGDELGGHGALTRTSGLDVINRPQSTTRANMLFRAELDVSYAGNAYLARRRGDRSTYRLDPSRVTFLFGSDSDPSWDTDSLVLPYDAKVVALIYNKALHPGMVTNITQSDDLEVFYPGEFVHWMPEPDPLHWWRGASWITSLVDDIALDGQISDHQSKYFENAATPNIVLLMDPTKTPNEVAEFAAVFNESKVGVDNAYKNWFLGGGTDVKVVGHDLASMSLKDLQGGLETRIASRSRVPAVILGAREGLSGSSLNTGNYNAARRLLSDGWFTPTVDGLCETLEGLAPPPPMRRLSHDPSAIMFLQEDRQDEANINAAKVASIRQLVDGGFEPDSAVATVAPEWVSSLAHTGKLSVQLQDPGAQSSMANDARTVMGRLGRAESPDAVNLARLVSGLKTDTVADLATKVVSESHPDIESLRAAMRAKFERNEVTQ